VRGGEGTTFQVIAVGFDFENTANSGTGYSLLSFMEVIKGNGALS
jgi:hypothetical protein